jgi:hypothetical protein
MQKSQKFVQFIGNVVNKNYHGANKYIRSLVEDNIKHKIALAVKNTKLF